MQYIQHTKSLSVTSNGINWYSVLEKFEFNNWTPTLKINYILVTCYIIVYKTGSYRKDCGAYHYWSIYGTSDIIIHGIAPIPKENAITMTWKKLKGYNKIACETSNKKF
jgi:hypothetical protein